jgi:hypothetical protein
MPAQIRDGRAEAAGRIERQDAKLRALWLQYQEHPGAYKTAGAAMAPVRARYDAEYPDVPPDGAQWEARKGRRKELGLDALYDEWSAAHDRVTKTIRAIRRAKAEGPFGVGVKLAAVCPGLENIDLQQNIFSALKAIENLTNSHFTKQASIAIDGDA